LVKGNLGFIPQPLVVAFAQRYSLTVWPFLCAKAVMDAVMGLRVAVLYLAPPSAYTARLLAKPLQIVCVFAWLGFL
jgi:hypothetical protein